MALHCLLLRATQERPARDTHQEQQQQDTESEEQQQPKALTELALRKRLHVSRDYQRNMQQRQALQARYASPQVRAHTTGTHYCAHTHMHTLLLHPHVCQLAGLRQCPRGCQWQCCVPCRTKGTLQHCACSKIAGLTLLTSNLGACFESNMPSHACVAACLQAELATLQHDLQQIRQQLQLHQQITAAPAAAAAGTAAGARPEADVETTPAPNQLHVLG